MPTADNIHLEIHDFKFDLWIKFFIKVYVRWRYDEMKLLCDSIEMKSSNVISFSCQTVAFRVGSTAAGEIKSPAQLFAGSWMHMHSLRWRRPLFAMININRSSTNKCCSEGYIAQ